MRFNPYFFILFLILPIVFAESSNLGDDAAYIKVGQVNQINVLCTDATICSTGSCNLSVFYPNGQVFISNQPMTYASSSFSYQLNATPFLGEYPATATCSMGYSVFKIIVNYSGNSETVNPLNIAVIIILFLFGVGLLVWAIIIPWENTFKMGTDERPILEVNYGKYAKLLLFFFSYMFIWLDIYLIWQAIKLVTFNTFMPNMFEYFFWISTILIVPIFFVVTTIGINKIILDSELLKLHKRGLNAR